MSAEPATILSRTGVAALAGHLPTPAGAAGDAVNALRFLAVDAVERADSGHPGTLRGLERREAEGLPLPVGSVASVFVSRWDAAAYAGPTRPGPAMSTARADGLVLFGATGDLARKQLFPSLYRLAASVQLDCPVVGVAATAWHDDELRDHARAAVDDAVGEIDEGTLGEFLGRLALVSGDYRDPETFRALATRLAEAGAEHPVHYLAIPPGLFATVVGGLAGIALHRDARVVVEKPFGRDLASARALNEVLHRAIPESAVFRIDHYLGKEAVENLLVYRFGNTLLEPVWNRRYVSSTQVTMAEDFGVEGRGGFYDTVGAVRDVVQNHLLQEPGDRLTSRGVELGMDFQHVLGTRRGAYERLLGDALDGNPVRFARQDGVEAAWRVIQPLIDAPGPVRTYPRGSWGPPAADAIADVAGGWHAPDVPAEAGR